MPRNGNDPYFNPYDGIPDTTGYSRLKTTPSLSEEELAAIFRPHEFGVAKQFRDYIESCAAAFYDRSFQSNTYEQFKAYIYAYKALRRGLERIESDE